MEQVILVDENDNVIGSEEKLKAHQEGMLHRAFSIFLFNSKNELLLQKRAEGKYHSGGLWTNSCCSHPRPSEDIITAGHRRLKEELNLSTDLEEKFFFTYKASFENGLIEHELDHVIIGKTDDLPMLNPIEASDYKYVSAPFVLEDINNNPNDYTFWFKKIVKRVIESY
jgi:isopentenyl-diphosphate delta-isomerase